MSSNNTTAKPQHKPNSALTPEERQAKKRLKTLSKLQSKIAKMEKAIAHAHRFAKTDVAEANKKTLVGLVNGSEYREIALSFVSEQFKILFLEKGESTNADVLLESTTSLSEPQRIETQTKAIITKVSDKLFRHMYTDKSDKTQPNDDHEREKPDVEHDSESRKRKRAETKQKRLEALRATKAEHHTKAKQMCRAMTKGEQKESMFCDDAALWGYTRQKYVERARLIYQSFLKLHPEATAPPGTTLPEKQFNLKARIWKALLSIEHVASIGCGPGSDVAGVLALRKCICMESESKTEYISPSVALLDYVIDQWKATILDIVLPIVAKEGLADLERIACDRTDVTHVSGNGATIQNERQGNTLFITSYLLSEQRDKWHDYYSSLAKNAKRGDIFYFCEPKPWQLHLLIRLTKEWLDFLWVDSSMFYSELQATDMRAGPAVLVAIKQ